MDRQGFQLDPPLALPCPVHVGLHGAGTVSRLEPQRLGIARHRAKRDPAGVRILIRLRRRWCPRMIETTQRNSAMFDVARCPLAPTLSRWETARVRGRCGPARLPG